MDKFKIKIITVETAKHYNPIDYYTFEIFDQNDMLVYDNDDSFLNPTECKNFAIGQLENKFNIKSKEDFVVEIS